MANRRMFSKTITASSAFLMMPPTSRLLYYDLGMQADDDGFVEHFGIMRMTEAKPDDLRVLEARGFVQVFDDKVLIISDWKENNYIQKDRYTPSRYLETYKDRIQHVYVVDTQVRLGKDRKGEEIEDLEQYSDEEMVVVGSREVILSFKRVNPSYLTLLNRKAENDACRRLIVTHGLDRVLEVVGMLQQTNGLPFFPTITKPTQLEDKWGALAAAIQKKKAELITPPKTRGRGIEI